MVHDTTHAPRQGFSLRRLFSYSRREALELRRDPVRSTLALMGTVLLAPVFTTRAIVLVVCSGLGSNASKPDFQAQFVGKTGEVKVTKDGGDIDALTGATITSRGVCEAVTSAIAAAASMG